MPARFFVDENMLPVGYALAAVRDDVVYPGHPALAEVPTGTLDPDWLPIIGKAGKRLVVITRDKKISRKSIEAMALRDNGVRMLVLTGKHDLTRWEKLDLVIRSWQRIERYIADAGDGPWVAAVTTARIRDLVLW